MARRVFTYPGKVSRWAPDARERLERAALELFAEQGFAATTVPQITARAGLTTRTFFRHFADKREVIFAGDEIPASAAQVLAGLPREASPVALVTAGLRQVAAARFDGRRDQVRTVRALIRSDEGLTERDLRKRADLVAVLRDGLAARGWDALVAALTADTAVTVLHVALDRWIDEPGQERPLSVVVDEVARAYADLLQGSKTDEPTVPAAG